MAGFPRFMAANLIPSPEALTLSSEQLGEVGAAQGQALGDGTLSARGNYSGALAAEQFLVEIDSIASGSGVGQATYRWKGGNRSIWEASGVATHDTLAELRDGVKVRFGGENFIKGDKWYIEVSRRHGRAALLKTDPSEYWRSTVCDLVTIAADLGYGGNVQAMILADHNLSDEATVTLKGGGKIIVTDDGFVPITYGDKYIISDVDWDSPDYEIAVPVNSPHLAVWLDETWARWRLEIEDPDNTDGIIKASGLYLGSYTQLSRRFNQGEVHGPAAARSDQKVAGGQVSGPVGKVADAWRFKYTRLAEADRDLLLEVWQEAHDQVNDALKPVWFMPDSADVSGLVYGFLGSRLQFTLSNPGRGAVSIDITEHA